MSTTVQQQRDFLTVDELAAYLRVSRSQAYALVWAGKVPAFQVGRSWRVPRAELEARLAEAVKQNAAT